MSEALFVSVIVLPSFGAATTNDVPRAPPAPGLFTGTIGTLSSFDRASAMTRAAVSVASPGASGMTRLIGPDGYFCANAWDAKRASAAQRAAATTFPFMDSSSCAIVPQGSHRLRLRDGRPKTWRTRVPEPGVPQQPGCARAAHPR